MEPGCVKKRHEERRRLCVGLDKRGFVEGSVREAESSGGLSLQGEGPVQHHPRRRPKRRHLQAVEQRQRRCVLSDILREAATYGKRWPRLTGGAVPGVGEIAGLEPASARLAGVWNARLVRPTPEIDVCVELLVNLGSPPRIAESI